MDKIKLLGHTATIKFIRGQPAIHGYPGQTVFPDYPRYGEDRLSVWLDFGDDPIGGTLAFPLEVPAKDYSPEEFLRLVKREGEVALGRMLWIAEKARTEHQEKEKRKAELDSMGDRLLERLREQ